MFAFSRVLKVDTNFDNICTQTKIKGTLKWSSEDLSFEHGFFIKNRPSRKLLGPPQKVG